MDYKELQRLKESLQKKVSYLEFKEQELEKKEKTVEELENSIEDLQQVREIFQNASLLVQNYLTEHFSNIVTKAIQTVFENENLSFKIEFVEKRNKTECLFWLEDNGHKYSLLDDRGYGIADVVSFALKVAYIMLCNTKNVLIQDEPFRNLDKERQPLVSLMVRELAEQLDFQFILASHSEELIEQAHKSFEVTKINNRSEVHGKTN